MLFAMHTSHRGCSTRRYENTEFRGRHNDFLSVAAAAGAIRSWLARMPSSGSRAATEFAGRVDQGNLRSSEETVVF